MTEKKSKISLETRLEIAERGYKRELTLRYAYQRLLYLMLKESEMND